MDEHARALLADQSGTIARQQLVALDVPEHEIRRLVHRRELARVHRGVYVGHTGSPTWIERAWAAVLATSRFDDDGCPMDSALAGESALRLLDGPGSRVREPASLHVVVPASRDLATPDGVVVERYRRFAERVSMWRGLLCVRYEEALIDAVADLGHWESFARVASAIGSRRTTPDRVKAAADGRLWMRERRWLLDALGDIAGGTCSVLERGFVREVLRAHQLPRPRQQSREVTPIGVVYRDAVFGSVAVELDGRAFHASPEQRDADLDRDLVAAAQGTATVRLGWGQVYGRPCQTVVSLARALGAEAKPCGPQCCVVS